MSRVLNRDAIDHFIDRGWVRVEEAFAAEDALAVQAAIWRRMEPLGVLRSDPSTWTQPRVHLRESYRGPEFQRCDTPRLRGAIEELVGRGRLLNPDTPAWGWWPVNFSVGRDRPWTVPRTGWHWDGHHFRHYVDSPDQGLLILCLFSAILPQGGGTLLAEGSHMAVARLLARHPEGVDLVDAIGELNRSHPWFHALAGEPDPVPDENTDARAAAERIRRFMQETAEDEDGTRLRVVEAIGGPGDVYLCHPFLYHAASANHRDRPRFICNRIGTLSAPMRIREGGPAVDLSPVEISIRRALGLGERERT